MLFSVNYRPLQPHPAAGSNRLQHLCVRVDQYDQLSFFSCEVGKSLLRALNLQLDCEKLMEQLPNVADVTNARAARREALDKSVMAGPDLQLLLRTTVGIKPAREFNSWPLTLVPGMWLRKVMGPRYQVRQ